MALAWSQIPHVNHQDVADITELEHLRSRHKEEIAAQGGRLTPLVFVLKAVVAALKAFPRLNSSRRAVVTLTALFAATTEITPSILHPFHAVRQLILRLFRIAGGRVQIRVTEDLRQPNKITGIGFEVLVAERVTE